jgi:hypothetical protein
LQVNQAASGQKKKAFAEAKAFCQVQVLLLRAKEQQHERKQYQRLNECQSDEECELDTRTRSRIPGKSFRHRSGNLALAKSGKASSKAHA